MSDDIVVIKAIIYPVYPLDPRSLVCHTMRHDEAQPLRLP